MSDSLHHQTPAVRNARTNEEWIQKWEDGTIPWHENEVHPFLIQYFDGLIEDQQTGPVVLVPLCGKSVDLLWLMDRASLVVGVELCERAVVDFFQENNVPYKIEPLENNIKHYQTLDARLQLYQGPAPRNYLIFGNWAQGDFFDIKPSTFGQKFDVIWDQASLAALNENDWTRYVQTLYEVGKDSCRLLLVLFDYDYMVYGGPPHFISDVKINQLFAEWSHIKLVTKWDRTEHYQRFGSHFFSEDACVIRK